MCLDLTWLDARKVLGVIILSGEKFLCSNFWISGCSQKGICLQMLLGLDYGGWGRQCRAGFMPRQVQCCTQTTATVQLIVRWLAMQCILGHTRLKSMHDNLGGTQYWSREMLIFASADGGSENWWILAVSDHTGRWVGGRGDQSRYGCQYLNDPPSFFNQC